jgi:hypothetical protein
MMMVHVMNMRSYEREMDVMSCCNHCGCRVVSRKKKDAECRGSELAALVSHLSFSVTRNFHAAGRNKHNKDMRYRIFISNNT